MHMSDGLITPIIGGAMLASSIGVMANATRKIDMDSIERRVPYMGVVGAFVFASQMINFAIPGTGSSGHIGGGMLLAILLGPHAGFLTMASILLVQALFFADGGLLAYGCNLFNLGFFTCYVAYPYIYKPLSNLGGTKSKGKIFTASVVAVVAALQMGAFSVVLQTILSGRTDLPFGTFVMYMQPVHLAIGLVEGAITAAIVSYLYAQRPDLLHEVFEKKNLRKLTGSVSIGGVLKAFAVLTVVVGVILSQFASSSPDGLEWSIENVSAVEMEATPLEELQGDIALLPDYDFSEESGLGLSSTIGTGVSGFVGSGITLLFMLAIGLGIRKFSSARRA